MLITDNAQRLNLFAYVIDLRLPDPWPFIGPYELAYRRQFLIADLLRQREALVIGRRPLPLRFLFGDDLVPAICECVVLDEIQKDGPFRSVSGCYYADIVHFGGWLAFGECVIEGPPLPPAGEVQGKAERAGDRLTFSELE
jgi:hypothetical protein